MLLLPILLPLLGGIILLFLPESWTKPGSYGLVLSATVFCILLPFLGRPAVELGEFPFGVTFALDIDEVSQVFSLVFVFIWVVVLRYAQDYMEHLEETKRFFAFYVATLGALLGLCYADNLITLYLFFELVGLLCLPLIAHLRSEEALRACRKYLYYSVSGAFMGLTAIFYFYTLDVPQVFQAGGIPELLETGDLDSVLTFTLVACVGFGCKAGMFPLHGWLKTAHPIAPAPASAILSAITTKAGVIAILRLLYYVVGAEALQGSFVQTWGLTLSILTIFMGSLLACREKNLKARLAYSTVSQVSYIIFALFLFHPLALVGGMYHLICHAIGKTALFLSAGTMISETGKHHIEDFSGIGKSYPGLMLLFTTASLSLVGLPLTGGFVSKWYIALAGSSVGGLGFLGVVMLIISALLTASYLIPLCLSSFQGELSPDITLEESSTRAMMPLFLAVILLILGVFPSPFLDFSLNWVDKLGLGGGL